MGLFGDKLLLQLSAKQSSNNPLNIEIDKIDKTIKYLLPFSCISLINSQLIVLSDYRRKLLCTSVLEFISKPEELRNPTRFVSKFIFELYQKNRDIFYNQFNPLILPGIPSSVNFAIEKDIVNLILNFTSRIYYKSPQIDRDKIRIYLLVSISFFQQEILPIINKIEMSNIENRQKLALDQVNFSSSIFLKWGGPIPFDIQSGLFNHHLASAMKFDAYE